jgi:hypothetical protein
MPRGFEPVSPPQQQPLDNSDIPINKAVLMGIAVIAGAFSFFQLSSCTSNWISTPEFVQAIEACNASAVVPVTIRPDGRNTQNYSVTIDSTPEIRASLEKCHQAALERFQPQPKPIMDRVQKP